MNISSVLIVSLFISTLKILLNYKATFSGAIWLHSKVSRVISFWFFASRCQEGRLITISMSTKIADYRLRHRESACFVVGTHFRPKHSWE